MALTFGDNLRIIGTRGPARGLLKADGVEHKVARFDRAATIDTVLRTTLCRKVSAAG